MRVRLDLLTPPQERAGLGDNYRVFVRVVEWAGNDVLQVPLGALFRRGEDWAVYRSVENRAQVGPGGDWPAHGAGRPRFCPVSRPGTASFSIRRTGSRKTAASSIAPPCEWLRPGCARSRKGSRAGQINAMDLTGA